MIEKDIIRNTDFTDVVKQQRVFENHVHFNTERIGDTGTDRENFPAVISCLCIPNFQCLGKTHSEFFDSLIQDGCIRRGSE